MEAAQAILEKSPPSALQRNLQKLRTRLENDPDASNALRHTYPIPFFIVESTKGGERPFLVCGYNMSKQDDSKYRSPWTNNLHSLRYPPVLDGNAGSVDNTGAATAEGLKEDKEKDTVGEDLKGDALIGGNIDASADNDELRPLEMTFNEVWDAYKNLYYGHEAVGSVFLKNSETSSFEGLFGIQKKTSFGSWNSASFVKVHEPGETECTYTVETFVCMILEPTVGTDEKDECVRHSTKMDVSLTTSKEVTRTCKIQPEKGIPINVSHIEHIGTLIEANEIDLRSSIEKVLIPKNPEILDTIQKKQISRPSLNPLMGMVMNSDVLKKKLAKAASTPE